MADDETEVDFLKKIPGITPEVCETLLGKVNIFYFIFFLLFS